MRRLPSGLLLLGLVVTPKPGMDSIPVYGRAYPEAEAYPAGITPQASDFVDCAVGVIASTLLTSRKRIQLRGLRQHQERLFAYFGVDPSPLGRERAPMSSVAPSARAAAPKEVA